MKQYSLYVHVPFCDRKCGYCSFYSVRRDEGLISAWLDAVAHEAEKYSGVSLRTVYIGGGTPSVLSLAQWQKLMGIIRADFGLSFLTEATCEINPNSLTEECISFLRDNKFSRISLGVQSLNDSELHTLGRIHDSSQAVRAMNLVRDSGLNLSCDLIFAIPGQTLRSWNDSLRTVMKYAGHISTYQLTLEHDTPMAEYYGNDELNAAGYGFYRYAQYMLPRHGFRQYEISSFAPDGQECRHNIAYWHQEDVIALGPSAVSYIDGVRLANPRTLGEYLSGGLQEREELSPRDRAIELAILSLRTKWGISRRDLLPELEAVILGMPADLFVIDDEHIALTQKGMRLGNAIWREMIGV
ncbi:MAG: radical SAM family heme chaperone HemW [Synergistaceae bacterium]|nr:radical SAM family heme chaperone HemW [Synergistaceae bacterium]